MCNDMGTWYRWTTSMCKLSGYLSPGRLGTRVRGDVSTNNMFLTDYKNGKSNNIKNQGEFCCHESHWVYNLKRNLHDIDPSRNVGQNYKKKGTEPAQGAHPPRSFFKTCSPGLAQGRQSSLSTVPHNVPFWTRKQVNISSFLCQEPNPTSLPPSTSSGPLSSSQKLEIWAAIWVIIPYFQRQRTCWWRQSFTP